MSSHTRGRRELDSMDAIRAELRALWDVAEAAAKLVAVINKPWPPEVVSLQRALRKYEAAGSS